MSKRYSIAEARQNLAAIVHELETQSSIELTRRGTPVAVLLSVETFRQLNGAAPSFWEAYTAYRTMYDPVSFDDWLDPFTSVRDISPGREME